MLVTAAAVERHAEPAAECRTDGTRRLAVILVNNPGAPVPDLTKARVGELVFGASGRSAATFYKEASYGQLDLTGDVFGWYTLDRVYKCGEFAQLRTAALKAADTDMISAAIRVIAISPSVDGCETRDKERSDAKCSPLPASVSGHRTRRSFSTTRKNSCLPRFTSWTQLRHSAARAHDAFPRRSDRPGSRSCRVRGIRRSLFRDGRRRGSISAPRRKASLGWLKPIADYRRTEFGRVRRAPSAVS